MTQISKTAWPPVPVERRLTTDFHRRVYCVFGLPFDAVTLQEASDIVGKAAMSGRRCFFSTPNLNFLINGLRDAAFRDSVVRSDLSLADGMPVVWLAWAMGTPIHERVAGSSVFETLSRRSDKLKVFFFGGPDGIAERAHQVLNASDAGLRCVGHYSPGFGSIEDMSKAGIIHQINASGADMVVVSLGAKKGQAWIERNLDKLAPPVVSHLGAVVNFVAGTVSRAPRWVQKLALEWLWRIKEEPALWRRYWGDGYTFLKLIFARFLPNLLMSRVLRPNAADRPKAEISIFENDDELTLVLAGAWTDENLPPLRDALENVTRKPCNIRFDLGGVKYVDSAFIGLLMLAYGHQSKIGYGFSIHALSLRVHCLLTLHCADFLLGLLPASHRHSRLVPI